MACSPPNFPISLFPYSATIPQFYRDSKSEQAVIARICAYLDTIADYLNGETDKLNEVIEAVNGLAEEFEKFKASGFEDYYLEQICKWIADNMPGILACAARFVWFDIDEEGYFNAHIPSNWQFLTFDTIITPGEDFGRLVLTWDNSVYSNNCICCEQKG